MAELQSGLEEWKKISALVVDVEAEEHSYLRKQGERRREVEQHQRSHVVPCGSNERCVCAHTCMHLCVCMHLCTVGEGRLWESCVR